MPRTLKRRSDAITGNNSTSESPGPSNNRRRRPSSSVSSVASSDASISPDPEFQTQAQSHTTTQNLVKKLVRLALSTEYARLPLRRNDISQKILKDNNASPKLFKPVFAGAQEILQKTFGMMLVELPSRERTTLKDRRTQATQGSKSQSSVSSNKSWILVSTLPKAYKQNMTICPPARASSQETESEYTALYTFVLSLIYLNNSVLTDAKLERYLKRVNADTYTPAGATDKLLQRMMKEGYIEKRRDTSTGEEIVEWAIGPRGKVEVGVHGVANLVQGVYGFGPGRTNDEEGEAEDGQDDGTDKVKIEREELEKRLERSLGIKVSDEDKTATQHTLQTSAAAEDQTVNNPRRGRPRRNNHNDSDDD